MCAMLALTWRTQAGAHSIPHSVLTLDVQETGVAAELHMPLADLMLAAMDTLPQADGPITLPRRTIVSYLEDHLAFRTVDGGRWTMKVTDISTSHAEQSATGPYTELVVHVLIRPPPSGDPRSFVVAYDGIVHQLSGHKVFVTLRRDWATGRIGDGELALGIIEFDPRAMAVAPLSIVLEDGSAWTGLRSIVALGMEHIREGTDHLLFLLALLLSAPLIAQGGRWTGSGGIRYTVRRLLWITLAFTVGHSLTLLLSVVGGLTLPQQPVEVLIAVSVLITAAHALRPLFPGREVLVAVVFGLVHGLAFATIISDLHLEPSRLALSLLGFNMGIEAMQVCIVVVVVPWLVLMSDRPLYGWVRAGLAVMAMAASVIWIAERTRSEESVAGSLVSNAAEHAYWLIPVMACTALLSRLQRKATAPPGT
jgi:hypothetical protein